MTLYSLDKTSATTMRESTKAALTAAGILTTTHYETGDYLIVTTTRSNKVIKMYFAVSRTKWYVGDAYSSGTTITNQVTVCEYGGGTVAEANMVVTDDILYMGWRITANDRTAHALFGRLATTAAEYVALGWVTNTYEGYPVLRDTSNDASIEISCLRNTLISTGAYYYQHDLVIATAGNVLQANAITGLKALQRPIFTTAQLLVFGDDIVLPGGATNGATSYFPQNLIIADGNV